MINSLDDFLNLKTFFLGLLSIAGWLGFETFNKKTCMGCEYEELVQKNNKIEKQNNEVLAQKGYELKNGRIAIKKIPKLRNEIKNLKKENSKLNTKLNSYNSETILVVDSNKIEIKKRKFLFWDIKKDSQ